MAGCSGNPKPNPKPNPDPTPVVDPVPIELMCTPMGLREASVGGVQMIMSNLFTVVAYGAPAVAQGAAAAGPGCPDIGSIESLTRCWRDPRCIGNPTVDVLGALRQRAQSTDWQRVKLGGQPVDLLVDAQGTLVVMDGQTDVPKALKDLLPDHRSGAVPAIGTAAAIVLPCGWNGGPCGAPPNDCPVNGTPTTRLIQHLAEGVLPQCASALQCPACTELCKRPPSERQSCDCAKRCCCKD
jgi:hypothetical protein